MGFTLQYPEKITRDIFLRRILSGDRAKERKKRLLPKNKRALWEKVFTKTPVIVIII